MHGGPTGGFICPATQASPGCTKSPGHISQPSWRRWQWLTVPTGLAWIPGSGHPGKICPAWPSKSAEMLNPSPTAWVLGHPNAFAPPGATPRAATRHLGLSCKCSAQEWEEVTPPSCLTCCETQLEPFFVPTGQPQKTKQETCLRWLFSRLPCTPHQKKKKHVMREVWREYTSRTCPLLPEAMKLNQDNFISSSCPSLTQLLLSSHPISLKLSRPPRKFLQGRFTYCRA